MQNSVKGAPLDEARAGAAARPLTVEERLAPKLKDAEWLLLLVLAVMLWTAGWVDLLTHRSRDTDVLGLYSVPYFGLLLAYTAGFGVWGWLIFPKDSIDRLRSGITYAQRRPWLGLGIIAAGAAYLASTLLLDRWVGYPLLQVSTVVLVLMICGAVLAARPAAAPQVQPWRKVVGWALAAWAAVEVVLQLAALAGALPVPSYAGLFTPYGRLYQSQEGFADGRSNKYGWYYPEFRLAPGSRRIVLTGDSYVLAAQVPQRDHMGLALERLLAAPSAPATEVLGLGTPGYGPGVYAEPKLFPYSIKPLAPSEVVVVFHLANDVQAGSGPTPERPFYEIKADGTVDAVAESQQLRHDIWHTVIRGYEPLRPMHTAVSHLLSLQLAGRLLGLAPATPVLPLNTDTAGAAAPFGEASFLFAPDGGARADESMAIALGQLRAFKAKLDAEGVPMRLVALPYFPADFYAAQRAGWTGEVGTYDALRPERALAAFAAENGVPFLGLGAYMRQSGMAPAEVQALFLRGGAGHLSSAGHSFVAQALYDCFYTQQPSANAGCAR